MPLKSILNEIDFKIVREQEVNEVVIENNSLYLN